MAKLGVITNKSVVPTLKKKNEPKKIPSSIPADRSDFGLVSTPSARPFKNVLTQEPEKDPYAELIESYKSSLQSAAAAQRAALEKMYGETAGMLNKNYDKNANYAYINYKQQKEKLPEELSNMGVTGGASESANIKLQNAYGANLANNEFGRNNDLASVRRSMTSDVSAIDSDLNRQLASAYADLGSRSIAYKQAQKEKEKEEAKQAEVDKWNLQKNIDIVNAQKAGLGVYTWEDSDGKIHWKNTGRADKKITEIDKYNNKKQTEIGNLKRKGYNLYTWEDNAGKLHYVNLGKKKLTSSGSSDGSGGYSSGGGSSPAPVPYKDDGNNNKSKPSINYTQAQSYYNSNLVKILSDPYAVVEDLDKKVKQGKMNEITADYIYTKFPQNKTSKNSKGKRKKKR